MTLTPRIGKSPYFDATVRYGATSFMAYNNMYMPLGYDTPENEFWHIVNDPVLSWLGENHFWLSRADSDLLLWAKGVAVFAGMDVDIREPDASALQFQGPKSRPRRPRASGASRPAYSTTGSIWTQTPTPTRSASAGW